ncbi:hypothetical protein CY34DRAFT_754862 [Suillus luteus UH-Slu-Lm8-n1]|uniref:Uncharacterized protein n=1 Tax=Suillus luteus UH-Slu-Lm8-n1 TaxID=930992 RepID=A0A0C9ZYE2_9AGAM|nr:hypothetical protein CY34DRAFT_754862 [Suillus luteus UH-Slu-Lm8-n1]
MLLSTGRRMLKSNKSDHMLQPSWRLLGVKSCIKNIQQLATPARHPHSKASCSNVFNAPLGTNVYRYHDGHQRGTDASQPVLSMVMQL